MRKEMKKLAAGFLAASLMVAGITTGGIAYAAANSATNTTATLAVTKSSLEEMLTSAVSDEYLAQAEYNVIMESFGTQRPFSNISQAEATHISLLLPLLEEYGVAVPTTDWKSIATVPASLEAAYQAGADAEVKNIAMYEGFLKEELPTDVKVVFEQLKSASENHLRAFQNAVAGNCTGTAQRNGKSFNSGRGCGQGAGGNGNRSMGNCLLQ